MTNQNNTHSGERDVVRVINNPTPLCIEFVLDETGSMSLCRAATVGGFNDFLAEQKQIEGECLFTLTKFEGGNLTTPYQDLDIGFVPEMNENMFVPGGITNLYDALGIRIQAVKAKISDWSVQPKVLIVVMTDGGDNASTTYNAKSIHEQVQALEESGQWTFVYLGANQNALSVGSKMGFDEGNIRSFETAEMRETMRDLSAATTVYRASGGSTKNFF